MRCQPATVEEQKRIGDGGLREMVIDLVQALLLIFAIWLSWYVFRMCRASREENKLRRIEIPGEAREAVAAFAKLCDLTRARLKDMNVLHDDYYSEAVLRFSYGSTDQDTKAYFYFTFDWRMIGFHALMGYELGQGLRVENNTWVVFASDHICGLKAWGGMADTAPEASQQAFARRIADTFVHHCPDARGADMRASSDGLTISFKFR
ncbi:MAG: hypothetical protein ACI4WX_06300 [Aristaeellaceae bacterium]